MLVFIVCRNKERTCVFCLKSVFTFKTGVYDLFLAIKKSHVLPVQRFRKIIVEKSTLMENNVSQAEFAYIEPETSVVMKRLQKIVARCVLLAFTKSLEISFAINNNDKLKLLCTKRYSLIEAKDVEMQCRN